MTSLVGIGIEGREEEPPGRAQRTGVTQLLAHWPLCLLSSSSRCLISPSETKLSESVSMF